MIESDPLRRRAVAAFPHRRRNVLGTNATPMRLLQSVASFYDRRWPKLTESERRALFAFAEWCLRQTDAEIRDAAREQFYAHLFDEPGREWSTIAPWLSPFVIEHNWSMWESMLTAEEMKDLQSLIAHRTETLYASLAIATQITECRFPRRPPLPDFSIHFSLCMATPASHGSSGTALYLDFNEQISDEWNIEIGTFIIEGMHHGLGSGYEPLPDGGIDFDAKLVALNPQLSGSTSLDEVREVGEALFAITASLVRSLWHGLIAVNLVPPISSDQRVADWVMQLAHRKKDALEC